MTVPSRAVFLSYASEDAAAARRLADALKAAGVEVWFDERELRGGDAWDRQIRGQIHDCALFVPLLSAHTEARTEGYFRREWRLAVDRMLDRADDAAFLLPVVIDPIDEAHARVPDRFRGVQWMRLPANADPAALVARIERLLTPAAADAVAPAMAAPPRTAATRAWRGPWLALAAVAVVVLAAAGYLVAARLGVLGPHVAPGASDAAGGASIAVLPFIDLSEKKDQEYFSDGLAEELLDLLAKIPGLRVTARTSSFYFKGRQATVAEIAKTLGVAHLLEGSVRKAGSRLRVTTQLIRADTGQHVWSETYDRELKDVFAVQDEIATAVVAALKLKLAPESDAGLQARGPAVPEAYEQVLLGRQLTQRGSRQSGTLAAAAFREALRLDPGYAAAYAYLASTEANAASATDDSAGYARAAAAVDKALSLAPSLAEAYVARSRLRLYTLDFAGSLEDSERALRIAPGDSRALTVHSDVLAAYGRVAEGVAALRQAARLDPLNRAAWSHLGNLLIAGNDRAAARAALERALALSPESESALIGIATLDLLEGHAERVHSASWLPGREPVLRLQMVAMVEHSLGHHGDSDRALAELVACCAAFGAYQVATVHAWRGEPAQSLDWLERGLSQRDSGLGSLKSDPFFDSLRAEPRYVALLKTLGLPP